jgi:hypothetical protein
VPSRPYRADVTISNSLPVEHVGTHFVEVLERDCDGVYVVSLVVLQSVLLKHGLDTRGDGGVSKLRHGGEHVVLNLQ